MNTHMFNKLVHGYKKLRNNADTVKKYKSTISDTVTVM